LNLARELKKGLGMKVRKWQQHLKTI
jgi:hypothetical protein